MVVFIESFRSLPSAPFIIIICLCVHDIVIQSQWVASLQSTPAYKLPPWKGRLYYIEGILSCTIVSFCTSFWFKIFNKIIVECDVILSTFTLLKFHTFVEHYFSDIYYCIDVYLREYIYWRLQAVGVTYQACVESVHEMELFHHHLPPHTCIAGVLAIHCGCIWVVPWQFHCKGREKYYIKFSYS